MMRSVLVRYITGWVGVFILLPPFCAQNAPPKTVGLPDGTQVHLYLKDDLDSQTSHKGDIIRFQVREDVVVGNVVVLPAGSFAQGHITEVGHRGMAGHAGRLSFSIDYIAAPDGTRVPVASSPSVSGGSNAKVAAAASALYGPEALLIRGWNADLRKGTMLNAYVLGNHEIGMDNLTVRPTYPLATATPAPSAPSQPSPDHPPASAAPLPPSIVLVDPTLRSPGETVDVPNPTLTIRGMVLDPTGVPVVTVNGAPAVLHPRGPQSAEFTFEPAPLQAGNNQFEVVATNSASLQSQVTFVVCYHPAASPARPVVSQPASKSLSKADIVELLKGGVPDARVVDIVKQRGISFLPTVADLKEIRAAGGADDLIDALSKAGPD